ncbi:MaoC family dehydratase [Bradyrhizobium prioriisuperbiae]|uniref:MaoC family dehydratase n=1 Tax=Bradyrhizobium prioriisuperbiae TaxID=2854389 RepID=UPI0028E3508E|nr:MaoC family dehydratase [Bradyrhizobium prioritasuperba]
MPYFDDMQVGERSELGSFTFTAELIKAFARQFDPQPFHLDEEAGRKSLFGGLCASGWHVGSVGMKLIVARNRRVVEQSAARGVVEPAPGPSPGFRELKWLKPVMAGDTLTYSSEIVSLRTSASKPEWGILQARNSAENQRGELVFTFLATAFIPRRIG